MEVSEKLFTIIPAAGMGTRLGHEKPKQYLQINGTSILEQSLKPFCNHPQIEKIVVALAKDDPYFSELEIANHSKITVVEGGNTRAQSVFSALNYLTDYANADDWICVHDAARPCLVEKKLQQFINAIRSHAVGGILALPVSDTIKQKQSEQIATLDRNFLYQAQTPQMFRFGILYAAMKSALEKKINITDEAMAIEQAGQVYSLFPGDKFNIKVTYAEDLMLVDMLYQIDSWFKSSVQ